MIWRGLKVNTEFWGNLWHVLSGRTASDATLREIQKFEAEVRADEREACATAVAISAQVFHEAYERLAPQFGYETRRDSAVPWEQVPERNRNLMVAVCGEIAAAIRARGTTKDVG